MNANVREVNLEDLERTLTGAAAKLVYFLRHRNDKGPAAISHLI